MIRGILLALLMVPPTASALDIKFGLMQPANPLYENKYDGYVDANGNMTDDDGLVGRIEIIQRFKFNDRASFNVFATHMSLWNERDPHYGINAIGAEIEFNFPLLK